MKITRCKGGISLNCLLFLPALSWCNFMFVRPAHCYNAFVSSSLNKKSICQTKRLWKNNENVLYGAWLKTCYISRHSKLQGAKTLFFLWPSNWNYTHRFYSTIEQFTLIFNKIWKIDWVMIVEKFTCKQFMSGLPCQDN